jgi:hypothetical protein
MSRRAASRQGERPIRSNPDKPRRETPQENLNGPAEKAITPAALPVSTAEQQNPNVSESGTGSGSGARPVPDRRRLHGELIEMRERYREAATEAGSNLERFEELCGKVKTLLDEEFPGWEAGAEDRRSDMVTLYFQYRADADRAAGIQEKFEQLSRDIDVLLKEEFPDWQPHAGPDG